MFKFVVPTLFISLLLFTQTSLALEDEFFIGKVDKVLSGDRLIMQGGTIVELAGIDVANLRDPNPAFRKLGGAAVNLINTMVKDKSVRFEFIENSPSGKKQAYLFSSGAMVNARLLKKGLAVIKEGYGDGEKYYSYFVSSQSTAFNKKVGIWALFKQK